MMADKGLLMHISSLPSPYGIGSFGKSAYEFADYLHENGYKYWQTLPLGPTGFRDSPYQSFSAFAGNPYFLDLDMLCESGLLEKSEFENVDWGSDEECVDFGKIYAGRFPVLSKAFSRFDFDSLDYKAFCFTNSYWLNDYALFMSLKKFHDGLPWYDWDRRLRTRDPYALSRISEIFESDCDFWKMIQYLFFIQWKALKEYINSLGIKVIGDMPIYVALDSADVWSRPSNYILDNKTLKPLKSAGCPPDSFAKNGQLWGNPIYDWERLEKDGYSWWIQRFVRTFDIFDCVRIDHFRGFEAYYSIDLPATDAKNGVWIKGPGMKLFSAVEHALGHKDCIAEDLGFISPEVDILKKEAGFPGMKVFEFAFDEPDSVYLPEHYDKNCIAYVGTHDNDTLIGWLHSLPFDKLSKVCDYIKLKEGEELNEKIMSLLLSSKADTVILSMQDILGLGSKARMNIPSTEVGNWTWRIKKDII